MLQAISNPHVFRHDSVIYKEEFPGMKAAKLAEALRKQEAFGRLFLWYLIKSYFSRSKSGCQHKEGRSNDAAQDPEESVG